MVDFPDHLKVFANRSILACRFINKKSQSNLGRAALPPLMQRMDSLAACSGCSMPTADESNHSDTAIRCTMTPQINDSHAANNVACLECIMCTFYPGQLLMLIF